MSALEIPANYEAITPEWLTQALCDNGTLEDAAVTSVEAASLGGQRGGTGIIVHFELEYGRDEDGAPPLSSANSDEAVGVPDMFISHMEVIMADHDIGEFLS